MTPVINPWIFYIMPVCENVSNIAFLLATIIGIALIFLIVGYFCDLDWNREDDAELKKRVIKKLIPFLIIALLLTCLIPTEETITKMIIAQNVTFERVDMVSNAVSDTVANVYNDIMNLFQDSGAANG